MPNLVTDILHIKEKQMTRKESRFTPVVLFMQSKHTDIKNESMLKFDHSQKQVKFQINIL